MDKCQFFFHAISQAHKKDPLWFIFYSSLHYLLFYQLLTSLISRSRYLSSSKRIGVKSQYYSLGYLSLHLPCGVTSGKNALIEDLFTPFDIPAEMLSLLSILLRRKRTLAFAQRRSSSYRKRFKSIVLNHCKMTPREWEFDSPASD